MLPTTAVFVMEKLERARVGNFSQCRSESLVALPFVEILCSNFMGAYVKYIKRVLL